jgi:hypothetical protein
VDFFTKIVNDFGAKDYPNTQDASLQYAKDKSLILYFGHFTNGVERAGRMISFKGFLESYKLGISFKTEAMEAFLQDGPDLFPQQTTFEYQLDLAVPSTSPEEGELNLAKFEELNKMIRGLPKKNPSDAARPNYMLALMANFIHNGTWTSKQEIEDFDDLKKHAALIYLSKSNLKIDTEMGFWETKRGLIPKVFSTQFQMHIIVNGVGDWGPAGVIKKEKGTTKKLTPPWSIMSYFMSDGKYNKNDIELWPWGVTHSGMKL